MLPLLHAVRQYRLSSLKATAVTFQQSTGSLCNSFPVLRFHNLALLSFEPLNKYILFGLISMAFTASVCPSNVLCTFPLAMFTTLILGSAPATYRKRGSL